LNVNSVGRSFLRCGKDRVSIFFGAAAQYIEVDGKLARWNVAIPPIGGGKATGFAVTEAGRSFVNLLSFSEPDNTVRVIGNLKSMWTRDTALIGTWATIFFSSLTGLLAQPKMCGTVARRPFQKPGGRL
jgi:hypothetical protein